MASSMTAGDRRWGSSRRGGMTVLGKVAVPKPINLPSQRLENHGLDPNVEIVPKGTLSWGSRPSSSGSNAWGSSVLSPRAESGHGSPCYLRGRPSSGGGSRPSTASSEKTQESSCNIWISNSRPSSASGALASNSVSLTALRPRSAESRPGSSQLSRFAEPISEGLGAWGANNAAHKLQSDSPVGNNFSLSSGDFPSLGSEKSSGKNLEVLEHHYHVRPGSSSGRPRSSAGKICTTSTGVTPESIDEKGGKENLQTNDSPQHLDDGLCPRMNTWHGEHYPYQNTNIPLHPQAYEVWRAPVNPPSGVWYSPPSGPPHPPYGPPGGYPIEPISYYHPQFSGSGLSNSRPALPQASGPRGPSFTNVEICMRTMEPYMHPAMPIRPNFYPGYHGPPMRFCGSNEQEYSYTGMLPGPSPSCNGYVDQNRPKFRDSHSGKGQVEGPEESGPLYDSLRQYNAPVKHKSGWEKNDQEQCGESSLIPNAYIRGKAHFMRMPIRENARPRDDEEEEMMNNGSQSLPHEAANMLSCEPKDGSCNPSVTFQNNMEDVASVNPVVDSVNDIKNQSLIQKIEGLNAKAREYDGMNELYDKMRTVNVIPTHSLSGVNAMAHLERHHPSGVLVPVTGDMNAAAKGKSFDDPVGTVTAVSRISGHKVLGRGEYRARGRWSGPESDGWRKSAVLETTNLSQSANAVATVKVQDICSYDGEGKDESALSIYTPCDNQRAKMREIAKQRATQLQKEEEERIREQKAKAHAKLEELNRRSGNQSKEANSQKLETVMSQVSDQSKVEICEVPSEMNVACNRSEGTSSTLVFGSIVPLVMRTSESSNPTSELVCSNSHNFYRQEPVLLHSRPSLDSNDTFINGDTSHQTFRVQKGAGYKQKESSVLPEKDLTDKQIVINLKDKKSTGVSGASKEVMPDNFVSASTDSSLSVESGSTAHSSVHARKRGSKGAKNKHKVDGKTSKESDLLQSSTGTTKLKVSKLELKPDLSMTSLSDKNAKEFLEKTSSLPIDAHDKASFSMKYQHQQKVPRNFQGRDKSQGNDPAVWAPVKSSSNAETTWVNDLKASESASVLTVSDNLVAWTSPKTKRAEMERYVPKRVADELAQQSILQVPSPASVEQWDAQRSSAVRDQSIPKSGSSASRGNTSLQTIEGAGKPVEPCHCEIGNARQTKAHGSWRQLGSVESTLVRSEDSSFSNVYLRKDSSNPQSHQAHEESSRGSKLQGQGKLSKPVERVKGQKCKSSENQTVDDGWGDGWNIVEEPVVASSVVLKGHSGAGRGKKHLLKGHRGGPHQNFDQRNPKVSNSDTQVAPPLETSLLDNRPASSIGNRAVHWQRKSELHLSHEHQANRNRSHGRPFEEGEKIARMVTSKNYDPEPPSDGIQDSCADSAVSHKDLSEPGGKECSGTQNMGHKEFKRTRKNILARGWPKSPSKEHLLDVDSGAFTNVSSNDQRTAASGKFRKNGNCNNDRFDRGHGFQGDRSFIAENSRQNQVSGNRDRQRHNNSHYEYQPIRVQNNMNNSEGQLGNKNMTERSRERRPVGHFKNGGVSFPGRQSGSNNAQTGGNFE